MSQFPYASFCKQYQKQKLGTWKEKKNYKDMILERSFKKL